MQQTELDKMSPKDVSQKLRGASGLDALQER